VLAMTAIFCPAGAFASARTAALVGSTIHTTADDAPPGAALDPTGPPTIVGIQSTVPARATP
jgi:hypothetical protein